jgi:hypothetical protein
MSETADILDLMRAQYDPLHVKRQVIRAMQRDIFGRMAEAMARQDHIMIENDRVEPDE